MKDVIIKRLQDENLILRDRCSKLEQKLVEFECSTNNLEQYGRRNNIIIGRRCSIKANQLEESVTEIFTDINIDVASNDVEACHKIGKVTRTGSTKTIIHFVNRKHAKHGLCNKKQLSQVKKKYTFNTNNNPFCISKNLTRTNESWAYQGRKLKHNSLVNACYTRDGTVTIKINEHSKAIKIQHMNDLLEHFLNYDFENEPSHDASPDVSGQWMY